MRCATLTLAILAALVTAWSADGPGMDAAFTTPIDQRVWHDWPDEVIAEARQRLFLAAPLVCYVDPYLPNEIWPGTVQEFSAKPLGEILDALCAAQGLRWRSLGRCVWVWRPADPAQIASWQSTLLGADPAARTLAGRQLAATVDPAALRALLNGLAAVDVEVERIARQAILRSFMNVPLTGGRPPKPDPAADRKASRPGPWVAWSILLSDPAARADLDKAQAAHAPLAGETVYQFLKTIAEAPVLASQRIATGVEEPEGTAQEIAEPEAIAKVRAFTPANDAEVKKLVDLCADLGHQATPDWAPHLIRMLAEPTRFEARKALAMALHGNPAFAVRPVAVLKAMIMALSRSDPRSREAAGVWVAPSMTPGALTARDHETFALRNWCEDLARRPGPTVIGVMGEILLGHCEETARLAMAAGFEGRHDPAAVPFLVKAFREDREPSVRRRAAETIGRGRLLEGLEELRKAMQDPNPVVRQDAAIGLAYGRYPDAGTILVEHLPKAEPGNERNAMIQLLVFCRHAGATAKLEEIALAGSDAVERRMAVAALSLVRIPSGREVLAKVLAQEQNGEVLLEAAGCLRPHSLREAWHVASLLGKALAGRPYPEATAIKILEGLVACAAVLDPDEPCSVEIRTLVQQQVLVNPSATVRLRGLNALEKLGITAETLSVLEQARDKEKDPLVKRQIEGLLRKHRGKAPSH